MRSLISVIHWPILVTALLLWVAVGNLIFRLEPRSVEDFLLPDSYLVFFGLVFGAVYFTFATLLEWKRALILALGIVVGLWLQLLRLFTLLNALLLVLLLLAALYYLGLREDQATPKTEN